jgi:hypothetical protein
MKDEQLVGVTLIRQHDPLPPHSQVVWNGTPQTSRQLFVEEYPRQYPQPQQTTFRFLRSAR